MAPLLPFEELVKEECNEVCKQVEGCKDDAAEDCALSDPRALLHVTNRRKVPSTKIKLPVENNNLAEIQTEYENLLLKSESQKTISDIQIDCLARKLAEADYIVDEKCSECAARNNTATSTPNENCSLRESNVIIEQLREKIALLEMEKSSSQQNLDCAFGLATEQTLFAQEKCEKLYEELLLAREEATLANKALVSAQTITEESDWLMNLLKEAQELKLEFENSKVVIGSISSVVEELHHFLPSLLLDVMPSASESSNKIKSIIRSHEEVQSCLRNKVRELEDEKLLLYTQASELRSKIDELNLEVQNSGDAITELNGEYDSQIQMLQREILSLQSSSMAKEKESIRKELEKTKLKLKDTESKLRNAIQDKTKLEGEKSSAEREIKRLQGLQVKLERDMSKQESIIGRRRDSILDTSSHIFDRKRGTKGSSALAEQAVQEEHKKLEVLAFEMEAIIASLEDQLATTNEEKEEATSRAEYLASELQTLSDELSASHLELSTLKEEVSMLHTRLGESKFHGEELEASLKTFSEEKEELLMQLTDALLSMEEEKAIWLSKEKASVEAIEGKEKLHSAELALLSKELSEARNELEICRKKFNGYEEWLTRLEEKANFGKQSSKDKPFEIYPSINEEKASNDPRNSEIFNPELDSKCQNVIKQIDTLQLALRELKEEREYLLGRVQNLEANRSDSAADLQVMQLKHELEEKSNQLANFEANMHNDQVNTSKEKAKLRMRLRGTQAKLDSFRVRYQELVDELIFMNKQYEVGSTKLKNQLVYYGSEVLNLKRQLAASTPQQR